MNAGMHVEVVSWLEDPSATIVVSRYHSGSMRQVGRFLLKSVCILLYADR